MLVVGLTGGIGSGKSLAADYFAEFGAPVIDTDQIARDIVTKDSIALQKIIEHFGPAILNSKNELDRAKLRHIVFQDKQEKVWLEKLLHPLIRQTVAETIARLDAPYCIVVIPLLVETLPNPLIQRILVVDTPEPLQISRTMQRDGASSDAVKAIIASQAPRKERLEKADDIITNDNGLSQLQQQVEKLHQQYLRMN